MGDRQFIVGSYFDGRQLHADGPFTVTQRGGVIESIQRGEHPVPGVAAQPAGFLMPGLVEAHAHLFLDGGETDQQQRAVYLKAPLSDMLAVGRRSLAHSLAAGVTLVRDAGDIHGVNQQMRALAQRSAAGLPRVLSAGKAVRAAGGYGRFMALELADDEQLASCIAAIAPQADQIKIILTGIIDFDSATVKGAPQFTVAQASRIVQAARAHGLRTFAHCSGAAGVDIALAAGIDSIEHGYFITREQLRRMADKAVNWVPTLAPVHHAWARPDLSGCAPATCAALARILDGHRERIAEAYRLGVPVLVGSDAGSPGVPHGSGLVREIALMAEAGVDLARLLHSATALARASWGLARADIAVGCRPDLLLFAQSPFDDLAALQRPAAVVLADQSAGPAQPIEPTDRPLQLLAQA